MHTFSYIAYYTIRKKTKFQAITGQHSFAKIKQTDCKNVMNNMQTTCNKIENAISNRKYFSSLHTPIQL